MASQLPDGAPMPLDGSLPLLVSQGSIGRTFSAYVHVPFCSVRCGYCDFNTYTNSELKGVSQNSFSEYLRKEIVLSREVLNRSGVEPRSLHTVFFGGGTPTLLPAQDLVSTLEALRETFGLSEHAEVTVEANPETLTSEYVQELADGGVTRISVGMQSAVPHVLKTLDRTHNPDSVPVAINAIKSAGLSSSVDLIYGTPGESLEDWRTTLAQALELQTDHISAYALIVEEGTALARRIRSGELSQPSDDLQADMYELADAMLSEHGFTWYEISNWSISEATRSQHNIAYWADQDWWGYGPGAHSAIGGTRFWNVKHPSAYVERLSAGNSPALACETPDPEAQQLEQVLLGSRLSRGISTEGFDPISISKLIAAELIEPQQAFAGRLVLTLTGRLRADEVVRTLLFTT